MTGKAILLVIMSTFVIFSRFGIQNVSVTNQAFDDMADYSYQNMAYNAAVAGANAAIARMDQLRSTPPSSDTMTDTLSINGCTVYISCDTIGNTRNYRMTASAVASTGKRAFVTVTYQPASWGNFAYYSESEGSSTIWWMAKDSVFGPFHSQSRLNVSNKPYFGDYATMNASSLNYQTNATTDYPKFQKGFFYPVDYPMQENALDSTKYGAAIGGKTFTATVIPGTPGYWQGTGKNKKWINPTPDTPVNDLYLTFNGTNVTYTFGTTTETVPISTLSPNGVIWMKDGDMHVSGTIDGRVTLLATQPENTTNYGNVWLDNDITLTGNPKINENCDDYLGIVAEDNVWITDNSYNNDNINVDAAIYCHEGGFGAQNYKTRGNDGIINLYGGVVQKERQFVSLFSGTNITNGFSKSYHYDKRFRGNWPPYYPCGPNLRVICWYDGVGSSKNNNN